MSERWMAEQRVVFVDGNGHRATGRIAVGQPSQLAAQRARCAYVLEGLEPGRRTVHGANPLEALTLVIRHVGARLHEFLSKGGRVLAPDGKADAGIAATFAWLLSSSGPPPRSRPSRAAAEDGATDMLDRPAWLPKRARFVITKRSETTYVGEARLGRRLLAALCWDDAGRLISEQQLDAKGRKHGLEIERKDDGGIQWCAQWVHGKQHGPAMQLDSLGRPMVVTEFVKGRGVDIWMNTCAGRGSEVGEIRHYLDRALHGWVRWGDPRHPRCEESYDHGRRHGVFRAWDDGVLKPGYPQFYVNDVRVSQMEYVAAQALDVALPSYDVRDNAARRAMPQVVRDALSRAKQMRRDLAVHARVLHHAPVQHPPGRLPPGEWTPSELRMIERLREGAVKIRAASSETGRTRKPARASKRR